LEVGPQYLCLIDGQFFCGKFSQQWYGLNFRPYGASGLQYDPPGTNFSGWQRVWRINNAAEIAEQAEPAYAEGRRRWAIDHLMVSNGRPITEDTPVEAFGYNPPVVGDEDDDG
jgi:hypothetical protein